MEVKVFDSGDKPYKEWLEDHPEGYVLNTERSPSGDYARFHRPQCSDISKVSPDHRPDGFTKYKRIKVCAEESEPLWDWLINNRTNAVPGARPCKTCEPEVEEGAFEKYPDEEDYPKETDEARTYEEGRSITVKINRHERNRAARRRCLEYYGAECQVCDLRFEERYGKIGEGFIHVHHEEPLSEKDSRDTIDPIEDLKPLCPNCHAMLHRESPPLAIEELKERLQSER